MNKYTSRTIDKIISMDVPTRQIGIMLEGKFYVTYADQSKSRVGVKYNRLIKLTARLSRGNS